MKRYSTTAALLVCLTFSALVPYTGCQLITGSTPVKELAVTIEPCREDPEGDINFEKVTVKKGILDRYYPYFSSAPVKHGQGDPCFLISGNIINRSDRGYWISLGAVSTDDTGDAVPRTLDTGPITGVTRKYIDGKSAENFTLQLSWSENASLFKVYSQKSAIMPP